MTSESGYTETSRATQYNESGDLTRDFLADEKAPSVKMLRPEKEMPPFPGMTLDDDVAPELESSALN